jgi:hypothetical protein
MKAQLKYKSMILLTS